MTKVIKFHGGLGNQLFQYALYLTLKYKKFDVYADTTFFKEHKMFSGFEIDQLYDQDLRECSKLTKKLKDTSKGKISLIRKKIFKSYNKTHFVESINKKKYADVYSERELYLDGYWQRELFVNNYTSEVYKKLYEFNSFGSKLDDLKTEVLNCNSVSLHIRRGDFLTKKHQKIYVKCSINYYKRAIKLISSKIENPIFYVFSDDIEWAEKFMCTTRVDYNLIHEKFKKAALCDFLLMNSCKHQIISNSTYGWWAAFLNKREHKVIICPDRWYIKPTDDCIIHRPKEWISIDPS